MSDKEERLARWFSESPAGRYAVAAEQSFFRLHLQQNPGLSATIALHTALFGQEDGIDIALGRHGKVHIRSELPAIPLADTSVHILLLPHGLEICQQAKELLKECFRILHPQGRLLLSGFNPHSPWRLTHLWRTAGADHYAISPQQSCILLNENGFSTQEKWFSAHSAQIPSVPRWLQTLDHTLPKTAAALYGIAAAKQLAPLTPLSEKQRRQDNVPQWVFATAPYPAETPSHNRLA